MAFRTARRQTNHALIIVTTFRGGGPLVAAERGHQIIYAFCQGLKLSSKSGEKGGKREIGTEMLLLN